jgi:DNA primase
MRFDPIKFLDDFNIPYFEKGKNCAPNFVNIKCPMCNDNSNHGGFHRTESYYNCWQCGHHWLENVIMELLNADFKKAKRLIEEYSDQPINEPKEEKKSKVKSCICPGHWLPAKRHAKYLEKRNFDVYYLIKKYDLKFTDYTYSNYKWRIMAPIYLGGNIVSYQGRAIFKNQTPKYKACKKAEEVIPHKHILYNIDNVPGNTAVLVEGITDVWRLGDGAIATFGTGFTNAQIAMLANKFKKIFTLFDAEFEAQRRAEIIGFDLSSVGLEVENIELLYGDPASINQDEANELMEEVL